MPIIQAFHFHHSIKTRKADSVQLYLNYPKSVQLPDPTAAPIKMALPRLVASRLSNHREPSFSPRFVAFFLFFFFFRGKQEKWRENFHVSTRNGGIFGRRPELGMVMCSRKIVNGLTIRFAL